MDTIFGNVTVVPNPDAPKSPEIDLAVVAFYNHHHGLILYVNPLSGIYYDMEGCGQDVIESLIDNDSPDHGIWVWEGHVTWFVSEEGDGEPDYHIKTWRQPTDAEWAAVREQRNPFAEPPG